MCDPTFPCATDRLMIDLLPNQPTNATFTKKVKKPSPVSVGSFGLPNVVISFLGESKALSEDSLKIIIQSMSVSKDSLVGVHSVFADEQLRKTFKAYCKKHYCNEIYNFVKDYISYLNKPSEHKCKDIVKEFVRPIEADAKELSRTPLNLKENYRCYQELTVFLKDYKTNQEPINKLLGEIFKEVSEFFGQILY